MKTEKDLKPLIDLDILRYRCGFAADAQMKKKFKSEHPGATDEELAAWLAEYDYTYIALQNVKTVLEAVTHRFNPEYRAYIQGKGNFRDQLATIRPYKGNRTPAKPKYYNEIREYLLDQWAAIEVHGQEADDAIGIEQFDNPDKYTVIVSTDKDMDQIPGWHYNWVQSRLYYQTLKEANLFFWYQMMKGDTVDNIVGIPGVGEVNAQKIIEEEGRDVERVKRAVQDLYQRAYGEGWEAAYWENGQLLYIRRKPVEECPLL